MKKYIITNKFEPQKAFFIFFTKRMLTENDLQQIWNLVDSFLKEKKYFPFYEDLSKKYPMFFPADLDENTKNQIDDFINQKILDYLESKKTKWWQIMLKIFKNNDNLWKEFRKLNSQRFFDKEKFKEKWKEIENLLMQGEDRLTEKLVWSRSMWIAKASDAWYDMIYAIFPEWNQL